MSDEARCPRCGAQTHPVMAGVDHPPAVCQFRERQANLKDEEWEQVGEDDDIRACLETDFLPIQVFKWPVNPQAPQQGYLKSIYVPKWLKNSIIQFYAFKWAGMTLVEYLQKMHG